MVEQKAGSIFCARCQQRSPAGSGQCENCGQMFGGASKSSVASSGVLRPPDETKAAKQTGKIYRPPMESDYLPGTPPWIWVYALLLGGMGVVLIAMTASRLVNSQMGAVYGSPIAGTIIGVVIIIAGVFAIITSIGLVRLTMTGWRRGRRVFLVWLIVSVVLWLRGIFLVNDTDRSVYLIASFIGLSGFLAFDTFTSFLHGSLQDVADVRVPRFGVLPRRIPVPGDVFLGGLAIYILVPIVITIVSLIGMFIVLGLWILEPNILLRANRLEIVLMAIILVGGIANNLLLLDILQLERPRFGD